MRTAKVIASASVVALSIFGLASCANSSTEAASAGKSQTAEQTTESASPLPEVPEIDITTGAPAAGTNEALAWEALMGPDGEYAAAASYDAVLQKYGSVEPYATIYEAELRHVDALVRQLERAGVSVPANPYSGKIAAPDNLTAAAEAWAEGEILNVEMYDKLLARSTDANLTKVLNNLRNASLNSHLPLFEKAAANGGTLTAEQMNL
jgi:hypothetical protein